MRLLLDHRYLLLVGFILLLCLLSTAASAATSHRGGDEAEDLQKQQQLLLHQGALQVLLGAGEPSSNNHDNGRSLLLTTTTSAYYSQAERDYDDVARSKSKQQSSTSDSSRDDTTSTSTDNHPCPSFRDICIDFSTAGDGITELTNGQYVQNEWLEDYGMEIKVSKKQAARIIDTSQATNDLGSPNEYCGGPGVGNGGRPRAPGENCVPQGNVLITVQESDNKQAANAGKIHFVLNERVDRLLSIGLMNVVDNEGGNKNYWKAHRRKGKSVEKQIVGLGSNSIQNETINVDDHVKRLELHGVRRESCVGVRHICFCRNVNFPDLVVGVPDNIAYSDDDDGVSMTIPVLNTGVVASPKGVILALTNHGGSTVVAKTFLPAMQDGDFILATIKMKRSRFMSLLGKQLELRIDPKERLMELTKVNNDVSLAFMEKSLTSMLVDLAVDTFGAKTVALTHHLDPVLEVFTIRLASELDARGIPLTGVVEFGASSSDWNVLVNELLDKEPDVVVVAGADDVTLAFLKVLIVQASQTRPDTQILLSNDLLSPWMVAELRPLIGSGLEVLPLLAGICYNGQQPPTPCVVTNHPELRTVVVPLSGLPSDTTSRRLQDEDLIEAIAELLADPDNQEMVAEAFRAAANLKKKIDIVKNGIENLEKLSEVLGGFINARALTPAEQAQQLANVLDFAASVLPVPTGVGEFLQFYVKALNALSKAIDNISDKIRKLTLSAGAAADLMHPGVFPGGRTMYRFVCDPEKWFDDDVVAWVKKNRMLLLLVFGKDPVKYKTKTLFWIDSLWPDEIDKDHMKRVLINNWEALFKLLYGSLDLGCGAPPKIPTASPSLISTPAPSDFTSSPSTSPVSDSPSNPPSSSPTDCPSEGPIVMPTIATNPPSTVDPTTAPSSSPSSAPTDPTPSPVTIDQTNGPSVSPSAAPTSLLPSSTPTVEDYLICQVTVTHSDHEDESGNWTSDEQPETLECHLMDDFGESISEFIYIIDLDPGLVIENEAALQSGTWYIKIRGGVVEYLAFPGYEYGEGVPYRISVPPGDDAVLTIDPAMMPETRVLRERRLDTLGERTVLAFRICGKNATDAPSLTVQQIKDGVFGTTGTTMKTVFEDCSCGRLKIKAFGAQVLDWKLGIDIKGLDYNVVTNAILQKINAQANSADILAVNHLMFFLPPGVKKDGKVLAGGLGRMKWAGNKYTWFADGVISPVFTAHEIGHNLGMKHTGEGAAEYGDLTGNMGGSKQAKPKLCWNGRSHWYLADYYSADTKSSYNTFYPAYPPDLLKLASFLDYNILEADMDVVIQVVHSSTDFYLHYNHAEGANVQTQDLPNKITVVEDKDDWKYSMLRAGLDDNTNRLFTRGDLVIEVCNITNTNPDYAIISVGLLESACATLAPSSVPSSDPSSEPSAVPSAQPSSMPTSSPSGQPSSSPSASPTVSPTIHPTPTGPTGEPSNIKTDAPTSSIPSAPPTSQGPSQVSVSPS